MIIEVSMVKRYIYKKIINIKYKKSLKYKERKSIKESQKDIHDLFHKLNPKCHSPGIIYPWFEVLSFASDHRFGRIGDGSVVGKGS